MQCQLFTLVLFIATLFTQTHAAEIEIERDRWGTPHIYATSEADALYGLGYATAEDRALQMTYQLRIIQGRLAEMVGDIRMNSRQDTAVTNDRKMRTFGFYRAAKQVASQLDANTQNLLQAYCDGVNAYFAEHPSVLDQRGNGISIQHEPWTVADCLVSWWHLGQFFATDGTRELIAARNQAAVTLRTAAPGVELMPPDDAPAVVKRDEADPAWVQAVEAYARQHEVGQASADQAGPKFSHAWVIGGQKSSTGSAVLVSDPQTPVRNPSLFYEYHIQCPQWNARGIGVPGSPIILIGFHEHVAWGVTALGADQADLFKIQTDAAHPDQYFADGRWHAMTVHEETIAVRDGPAVTLRVRETELGPVATEFCFALPDEGEAVLRRIPMCETDRETVQAALAMMRAKDAESFHAALDGWRFPSLNMVYGDRRGQIGYRTLAAIPLRARNDRAAGNFATSYRGADEGWREMIPMTLLPQVKQPKSGYLYTANHKPVESWYPIPLGISTGAGGDTMRSWRLRELLEATGREAITPAMVRAMHFDRVNPARRALVAIAIKLREQHEQDLSLGALFAIDMLERWWKQGALSALDQEGAALAQQLNTFFRVMNTPLAGQYGGGESGLVYYLKTRAAEISSGKRLSFSKDEIAYIDAVFAGAWETASSQYGSDPGQWGALAKEILRTRQLGYLEGLDGFPSVDRTMDLDMPVLQDIDGGTIGCQTAQSYTQYVPMHDPDQAESLLPIGASEVREHPGRLATWDLWSAGQLHPAPLSRSAIQPHCVGTKRILTR